MTSWRLVRALQDTKETEGKADRAPPSALKLKHGLYLPFGQCLLSSLCLVNTGI